MLADLIKEPRSFRVVEEPGRELAWFLLKAMAHQPKHVCSNWMKIDQLRLRRCEGGHWAKRRPEATQRLAGGKKFR